MITGKLFKETVGLLCASNGYAIDGQRKAQLDAIYTILNARMTDEQFRVAAGRISSKWKPKHYGQFPIPADWLEACGMSEADQARESVAFVKWAITRHGRYASVDFQDPALHHTIERHGGWTSICGWSEQEWGMRQRQFSEDYSASMRLGSKGPQVLIGINDQERAMSFPSLVGEDVRQMRINSGRNETRAIKVAPEVLLLDNNKSPHETTSIREDVSKLIGQIKGGRDDE